MQESENGREIEVGMIRHSLYMLMEISSSLTAGVNINSYVIKLCTIGNQDAYLCKYILSIKRIRNLLLVPHNGNFKLGL